MPLTVPAVWLLVAFAMHLIVFWDAPRQWMHARREATMTKSRVYRLANVGTLAILGIAAVAEVVWHQRPPVHPAGRGWDAWAWAAAAAGIGGLALAAWAKMVLGPWFAPTAARFPGQPILRSGPYRFLHHPMYAGWWVFLAGLAYTLNSIAVLAACVAVAPLLAMMGSLERRLIARSASSSLARDRSHR